MAHQSGEPGVMQEPGLVVLTDNQSDMGLDSEWGLSILVFSGGQRWLWDCGQSGLFLDNAQRLGLDLAEVDGLALSHGHYDHVNGLAALMDAGFSGPVVAHEGVMLRRFSVTAQENREIGANAQTRDLLYNSLRSVEESFELAAGLQFVTDIPRRPGACQAIDGFFLDPGGQQPDNLPDDAFLLLDTLHGLVVILGCCHSGVANSLLHAAELAEGRRIFGVVGGLHLFKADSEALEEAVVVLEELGIEFLAPGHCTGETATDFLKERFSGRVMPLHTGLALCFS